MRTVNQVWQDEMLGEMKEYKTAQANRQSQNLPVINVTSQYNICSQWLIVALTNRDIPFRVMNLGAGVKRITTETELCPKCHGTGRC